MNHLFLNFGEHTAGVFVIDLPYKADVVWRWLELCVGHGWGKSGLWSSL